MIYFPEFRKALLRLVKSQISVLSSDLPQHAQIVRRGGWSINEDGIFVRDRTVATWNLLSLEALMNLPQWRKLLQIVEQTPALKRQFGTMQKTGSFAQQLTIEQIVRHVLPSPRLAQDEHTISVEPFTAFYQKYRSIDQYLGEEEFNVESVWPIPSLAFEQTSVRLDEDLVIRRLTPEEFAGSLMVQLIEPGNMRSGIHPKDAVCFGLVLNSRRSKDPTEMAAESAADYKLKAEIEERMIAVAGIVGLDRMALPGCIELPIPFGGVRYVHAPWSFRSMFPWSQAPAPLSILQTKRLRMTWRMLGRVNRSLHLCAVRLALSQTRAKAGDQMLDLVIAAEALYLNSESGQERSELSYRSSLRAAIWADPKSLNLSRRDVFDIMREAYSVRSQVAHGAEVSKTKLKLNGEVIQLHKLIELVRAIVRFGLRKAILQAHQDPNRKFEVRWEDKILS